MTLTELVTILAIIGIVTAFTVPRVVSRLDRVAVRRSAGELAAFYDRARLEAMVRGARVRVEFHADSLRAVLEDGSGAVVIRIHPNGLGAGGANTKLVVRRGAAAESLTTSRLGRLRWR
jgi:Tfp pilus assembly protein FimT